MDPKSWSLGPEVGTPDELGQTQFDALHEFLSRPWRVEATLAMNGSGNPLSDNARTAYQIAHIVLSTRKLDEITVYTLDASFIICGRSDRVYEGIVVCFHHNRYLATHRLVAKPGSYHTFCLQAKLDTNRHLLQDCRPLEAKWMQQNNKLLLDAFRLGPVLAGGSATAAATDVSFATAAAVAAAVAAVELSPLSDESGVSVELSPFSDESGVSGWFENRDKLVAPLNNTLATLTNESAAYHYFEQGHVNCLNPVSYTSQALLSKTLTACLQNITLEGASADKSYTQLAENCATLVGAHASTPPDPDREWIGATHIFPLDYFPYVPVMRSDISALNPANGWLEHVSVETFAVALASAVATYTGMPIEMLINTYWLTTCHAMLTNTGAALAKLTSGKRANRTEYSAYDVGGIPNLPSPRLHGKPQVAVAGTCPSGREDLVKRAMGYQICIEGHLPVLKPVNISRVFDHAARNLGPNWRYHDRGDNIDRSVSSVVGVAFWWALVPTIITNLANHLDLTVNITHVVGGTEGQETDFWSVQFGNDTNVLIPPDPAWMRGVADSWNLHWRNDIQIRSDAPEKIRTRKAMDYIHDKWNPGVHSALPVTPFVGEQSTIWGHEQYGEPLGLVTCALLALTFGVGVRGRGLPTPMVGATSLAAAAALVAMWRDHQLRYTALTTMTCALAVEIAVESANAAYVLVAKPVIAVVKAGGAEVGVSPARAVQAAAYAAIFAAYMYNFPDAISAPMPTADPLKAQFMELVATIQGMFAESFKANMLAKVVGGGFTTNTVVSLLGHSETTRSVLLSNLRLVLEVAVFTAAAFAWSNLPSAACMKYLGLEDYRQVMAPWDGDGLKEALRCLCGRALGSGDRTSWDKHYAANCQLPYLHGDGVTLALSLALRLFFTASMTAVASKGGSPSLMRVAGQAMAAVVMMSKLNLDGEVAVQHAVGSVGFVVPSVGTPLAVAQALLLLGRAYNPPLVGPEDRPHRWLAVDNGTPSNESDTDEYEVKDDDTVRRRTRFCCAKLPESSLFDLSLRMERRFDIAMLLWAKSLNIEPTSARLADELQNPDGNRKHNSGAPCHKVKHARSGKVADAATFNTSCETVKAAIDRGDTKFEGGRLPKWLWECAGNGGKPERYYNMACCVLDGIDPIDVRSTLTEWGVDF